MSDTLSTLKPNPGARRKPMRVGRGPGSGKGKTSGRGHKGMYSRSGSKHRAHKEGGQMPLYRRLPKRGFHNPFRVAYQVVNVGDLAAVKTDGTIDPRALRKARLVRTVTMPVKVLGQGTVDRPIVISAHAFSKTAQEKITAAGGRCETMEYKAAIVSKEMAA